MIVNMSKKLLINLNIISCTCYTVTLFYVTFT